MKVKYKGTKFFVDKEDDFDSMGLKYTHKSKKASASPLKLSAGRESATHL